MKQNKKYIDLTEKKKTKCVEIEKPTNLKIEIGYIEFKAPLKPELLVKFFPDTKFWCVEGKNPEIMKDLMEKYGSEATLLEVISDMTKKYKKERIILT